MKEDLIIIIFILSLIAISLLLMSYKFHKDTEFEKHEKLRRSEMRFYR